MSAHPNREYDSPLFPNALGSGQLYAILDSFAYGDSDLAQMFDAILDGEYDDAAAAVERIKTRLQGAAS